MPWYDLLQDRKAQLVLLARAKPWLHDQAGSQEAVARSHRGGRAAMKTIIAGGRSYMLTKEDYIILDNLRPRITEVVCGGATGADLCGKMWAGANGIPVRMFYANWGVHNRSAGPIRNRQMAGYADLAVLFPGGRGTDSMFREAIKCGLEIHDYRARTPNESLL